MKLTKEQVIEIIKDGQPFKYFSEWQDDKKMVLFAVKQFGWNLEYASEQLKNDKGVVLEAVKTYGYSLKYASEKLRDDKDVVLKALKKNGWSLMYASERLKKELLPQVLKSLGYTGSLNPIEIVKDNGDYLCLLTTEEQNNKEIILEAIKQNIHALIYVSQEIKDKIGDNNPVLFLEQWAKKEKAKELDRQLDKKEKMVKIKI